MQSKIKFIQNGNTVSVIEFNEEQVKDTLGSKVYMLCYSQAEGYYLTYVKDKFELPSKLYGSTEKRSNRILQSFETSSKGVGVLCTGDKGSGKSLLMSKVCNDSGLPVILINSPYVGSQFELFINRLGSVVLFFDEFGKTYKQQEDSDPQESILSLLDGSTSAKRLVLMTENELHLINDFILGRGGRVRYHFEYNKLEEEVTTQYCAERSCSTKFVEDVIDFSRKSLHFSFDTLVTLVNEHKEYSEDLDEFLPFINVDGRDKCKVVYNLIKIVDAKTKEDVTAKYSSQVEYRDWDDVLVARALKNEDNHQWFNLYDDFVSREGNEFVLGNENYMAMFVEVKLSNKKFDHRAF